MAIEIRETFEVEAPIDQVWRFLLNPERVVFCIPGGRLDEQADDRTFLGRVKFKVGAITAVYKGRVRLTEVDVEGHRVVMLAEGREPGGGTAKGTISSRLRALSATRTEISTDATIDLSGRVVQVGRGMIQGVSAELFKKFVASARERLEDGASGVGETADAADREQSPARRDEALRIVPVILRVLWKRILEVFRRLFGRG